MLKINHFQIVNFVIYLNFKINVYLFLWKKQFNKCIPKLAEKKS